MPSAERAFATLGAAMFVFDLGIVLYWINYASLRPAVTPDHLLGRMTATMHFFTVAAAPLGAIASGHVAEAFGLHETFAGMGVPVIGMVGVLYVRTDLRRAPDVSTIEAQKAEPRKGVRRRVAAPRQHRLTTTRRARTRLVSPPQIA